MNFKIFIVILLVSFLRIIGCAAAASLPLAAQASYSEENIESWANCHTEASSELGDWVNNNRDAARELSKWDSKHPEQSKTFFIWVITHQGKGIDAFTSQYMDWTRFNEIIKGYRPAVSAFIVWYRFHPKAAADLMQHPRALHWIWRHLYKPTLKVKDD